MSVPAEPSADWIKKRGRAPGTEGITGRLRLVIADTPVGVLKVEGGEVEILADGDAPATLTVRDQTTLIQLLGGELHPVVARLQGLGGAEGDVRLALGILMGLQGGSPWTGLAPRRRPS